MTSAAFGRVDSTLAAGDITARLPSLRDMTETDDFGDAPTGPAQQLQSLQIKAARRHSNFGGRNHQNLPYYNNNNSNSDHDYYTSPSTGSHGRASSTFEWLSASSDMDSVRNCSSSTATTMTTTPLPDGMLLQLPSPVTSIGEELHNNNNNNNNYDSYNNNNNNNEQRPQLTLFDVVVAAILPHAWMLL